MGQRQVSKDRLLRDRAQLLGALRDQRRGQASDLSKPELLASIAGIERRLALLELKLRELDKAQA